MRLTALICVALCIVLSAVIAGIPLELLFGVSELLLVVGVTFFALLLTFNFSFLSFLKALFLSLGSNVEPSELNRRIAKYGIVYTLIVFAFGLCVFHIGMFGALEDGAVAFGYKYACLFRVGIISMLQLLVFGYALAIFKKRSE